MNFQTIRQNPDAALFALQALSQLGSAFFGQRDLRRIQQQQQQSMGQANLINALGGRAQPMPVDARPGRATSFLGALGNIARAGQQYLSGRRQEEDRDAYRRYLAAGAEGRELQREEGRPCALG